MEIFSLMMRTHYLLLLERLLEADDEHDHIIVPEVVIERKMRKKSTNGAA